MYIVIIGAGGIGKRLTELALKDGNHNVIVIDKDQARCEEIARKFDAVAINADATQEDTLDESEVKKADVLVTTTDDDATNLMVVSLAKNKGVKHLISVVNQEESKPMYMEKGVKMVKSPNIVMAEHLYKSIKHPTVEEYMNVGVYAEIFRLPIDLNSKLSGKTITDIGLPKKSLIVAVERDRKFIIPTDDIELFSGDKVTVLAHKDQVNRVAALFSEQK
ncbi:K+ transport system, NAD-binding component [Thermoplasmatales archaeon SCGC AB-539-C06]|nr:K+ transport system, NAD-binding component [Thermoplasmatales archaeon SCGC AB-539-C06]